MTGKVICIDGCLKGWIDRQKWEWWNGGMGGQWDGWMVGQMVSWLGEWTNGQVGWPTGWLNGHMNELLDRSIDRLLLSQINDLLPLHKFSSGRCHVIVVREFTLAHLILKILNNCMSSACSNSLSVLNNPVVSCPYVWLDSFLPTGRFVQFLSANCLHFK